ncbi:MAG: translocation/assembly module TamB domain-containing protein [Polyangiaceae bacterium]
MRGKPDGSRPLDADIRHLAGSVKVEPGLVSVDVLPTGVIERKELPGVIDGTAEYHLRVRGPKTPDDTDSPRGTRMWATFAGTAGKVELVARALLDGDHVELTAHAPRARPDLVRAMLPGYPVTDTIAVHADVKGDLPRLTFTAAAQTEHHGSAQADGFVDFGPPVRAEITFRTDQLDPSVVAPTVPTLPLTSKGKVVAELGAFVSVRADLSTEPTRVLDKPVPAVDATAVFDGFVWTGTARIQEPGAPTTLTFASVAPEKKAGLPPPARGLAALSAPPAAIRFDLTTTAPQLASVPRLGGKLRGAATVKASGVVRDGTLDADLRGTVRSFSAGGARIARGNVQGRLHGPFDALSVQATVTAADAILAGYAVDDATVRISGPITRPYVRATLVDANDTHVEASAVVDTSTAAASRVKLRVEREGAVATGEIARVGVRPGGLGIEGVSLDSPDLGQIEGSLRIVSGELSGTLHAKDVDLAAARKLAALPVTLAGKADIDLALTPVRGGRNGHLHVTLRDGAASLVTGLTGDLTATFDGARVTTKGELTITGTDPSCDRVIARLRLTGGDGQLEGPLLSAKTWSTATGRIQVDADDWDLHCLAGLIPVGLPISEITGIAAVKATIERAPGERFLSIHDLKARTHYLTIVGPEPEPSPDGTEVSPWASRDIDIEAQADLDSVTGEARLALQLYDEALVAGLAFATTLDLPALLDPARRRRALLTTPVAGTASIPRREIARFRTLPTFIRDRIPSLAGDLAADLYLTGSIADPSAVLRVRAFDLAASDTAAGIPSAWSVPVHVDTALIYDGALATLDAHVQHDSAEVLLAGAQLKAPIERVLAGDKPASFIAGRAFAHLRAMSLADIPAFSDHAIAGHVSGDISLEGLGETPSLTLALRSTDLSVGEDLYFPEASVSLETRRTAQDGAATTALASVALHDREGGCLDASGYAQLDWTASLTPTLLEDRPADLYARFQRFRLATTEPFLPPVIRDLDGFLDGDIRLGWGRIGQTEKAQVQADLRVTDGSFYLPQLGQDLLLKGEEPGPVRLLARDGEITFENLGAESRTGRVRIDASARLRGLALDRANASLSIDQREALPVTLEGVELGEAWGTLTIDAHTTDKTLALDLRSPDLHFHIPQAASRDVQDLAENPDITLSHAQEAPKGPEPPPSRTTVITIRLDRAVVEGAGIYLTLATDPDTPPTFTIDRTTRATGDIRVQTGSVEMMNRKFVVDQALLHFRPEEVGNPYINATAHWDPPDGTRVFVDFNGVLKPITRDKLHFRSTPPRPQQDILAMLLFGSATGGDLTSGPSTGRGVSGAVGDTAVDIGGDLAAQQINALIGSITPLKGLSTRLGASESGGLKGSLVYQVGDTVTALATYEGTGPTGSSGATGTGQSQASAVGSLTLDWRFYKNWLIRAKVGAKDDATSADRFTGTVELLWQYRY